MYLSGRATSLLKAGTVSSSPPAASNSDVARALERAGTSFGLGPRIVSSISLPTGAQWTITFTSWNNVKPLPKLSVIPDRLENAQPTKTNSTNVARYQVGRSVFGGDISLSFRNEKVSMRLSATGTANELQRQLENLGSIGVVRVHKGSQKKSCRLLASSIILSITGFCLLRKLYSPGKIDAHDQEY